VGMARALLK
jgi:hypothetical protein